MTVTLTRASGGVPGGGSGRGGATAVPSRRRTRTRSSVATGAGRSAASSARAGRRRAGLGDAEDEQGHARVAPGEPRALAPPAGGAVDAEQDARARDAVAVQGRDGDDVGRPAVPAGAAAEVQGELHRVGLGHGLEVLGRGRGEVAEQARALEGDQAAEAQGPHVGQRGPDRAGLVDGECHERKVLGERQRRVGAPQPPRAEAVGPAQEHARAEAMAGEGRHERVGDRAAREAVALADVDRELQRRGAHSASPSARPSAATARPRTSGTRRPATPARSRPSSASRWLSSIQVEKVV